MRLWADTRPTMRVAWATRTLITRKLKGLDEIIRTSYELHITWE